ncbi:Na+/H+ antiporter subunit E [Synechococcus sp. AH-601-B19]|nr:Na+/H+ antiporter subunit E [Synechococcus sp. AH-601-B19]MDB4638660.1 Na+/H+ antiporter subunit E [bacterium]
MFGSLIRLITILLFRTFLWGLITANFTENNLIGGLVLSAIIPMGNHKNLRMEAILPSIYRLVLVPIQMVKETFQLILILNPEDIFTTEFVDQQAQRGSKLAKFVDVLVITSTPMSLVTGSKSNEEWYTHSLRERGKG